MIKKDGTRLRYDSSRVRMLFKGVLESIENLGTKLNTLSCANAQQSAVDEWMRTEVEHSPHSGYMISEDQRQTFYFCQQIAEIPHFSPMLNLLERT